MLHGAWHDGMQHYSLPPCHHTLLQIVGWWMSLLGDEGEPKTKSQTKSQQWLSFVRNLIEPARSHGVVLKVLPCPRTHLLASLGGV